MRSRQEFQEGHIPGSRNVPLSAIEEAAALAEDKETPLFVYCYSGARSGQAVHALRRMGYANVKISAASPPGQERWSAEMKVVIVGGVAGGATAAARIRRLDEQAEIVVFERSGYVSPMQTAACPITSAASLRTRRSSPSRRRRVFLPAFGSP